VQYDDQRESRETSVTMSTPIRCLQRSGISVPQQSYAAGRNANLAIISGCSLVQRAIGLPVAGSRLHLKERVGRSGGIWEDFSSTVGRSVIPFSCLKIRPNWRIVAAERTAD